MPTIFGAPNEVEIISNWIRSVVWEGIGEGAMDEGEGVWGWREGIVEVLVVLLGDLQFWCHFSFFSPLCLWGNVKDSMRQIKNLYYITYIVRFERFSF